MSPKQGSAGTPGQSVRAERLPKTAEDNRGSNTVSPSSPGPVSAPSPLSFLFQTPPCTTCLEPRRAP